MTIAFLMLRYLKYLTSRCLRFLSVIFMFFLNIRGSTEEHVFFFYYGFPLCNCNLVSNDNFSNLGFNIFKIVYYHSKNCIVDLLFSCNEIAFRYISVIGFHRKIFQFQEWDPLHAHVILYRQKKSRLTLTAIRP